MCARVLRLNLCLIQTSDSVIFLNIFFILLNLFVRETTVKRPTRYTIDARGGGDV